MKFNYSEINELEIKGYCMIRNFINVSNFDQEIENLEKELIDISGNEKDKERFKKAGYPKWPLFIIDAENYGTGMRYMNHDKANPNVELEVESIMLNELWFPIIIARTIRDIKQGEELCLNYWT